MERRSEDLENQPQTLKGRVFSVVDSARTTATHAAHAAQGSPLARNPLGMAIGSVAAGFLAGMLLPVTSLERERVGRLGERLTNNARTVAVNALEEGKTAVSMVIDDALSRAGESSEQ